METLNPSNITKVYQSYSESLCGTSIKYGTNRNS